MSSITTFKTQPQASGKGIPKVYCAILQALFYSTGNVTTSSKRRVSGGSLSQLGWYFDSVLGFQCNASNVGEVVEGIASGGRDTSRGEHCPVPMKNASHVYSNLKEGTTSLHRAVIQIRPNIISDIIQSEKAGSISTKSNGVHHHAIPQHLPLPPTSGARVPSALLLRRDGCNWPRARIRCAAHP